MEFVIPMCRYLLDTNFYCMPRSCRYNREQHTLIIDPDADFFTLMHELIHIMSSCPHADVMCPLLGGISYEHLGDLENELSEM